MKVYIDLEHLKSLANNMDKEVLKLIRENFDIYYCFDEKDIKKEKRQKIQKIENWQKNLSEGRKNKSIQYNIKVPLFGNDLLSNSQDYLQSIFLTTNTDIPNGILSCVPGKELVTLRNLLIEGKCVPAKFYYTRPEDNSAIKTWDIVTRNISPCTDIIINDRYLFAQSHIEYENNAYKLIEELSRKSIGQCLNIVIITRDCFYMKEKNREKNKYEYKKYPILIDTIIQNLREKINLITDKEVNITIVAQKEESHEQIHDRAIFTNYKLFISGDSLKYYKEIRDKETKTNKIDFISNGLWFGVCSLFDDEHNKIAKRFLQDLQILIDNLKKIDNSHIIKPKCIHGDKKSNFLVF